MTQPDKVGPWLMGVDFAIEEPGRAYKEGPVDYGSAALDAGTYGGGGGYSLAPAAANDMLGQAREALEMLNIIKNNAENLKRVQPPAKDPASVAYNARLANGSGVFDHGVAQIDTEIAYLKELIGKIEEAFKKITGHDATAAADVTNAGNPPREPRQQPRKGGAAG